MRSSAALEIFALFLSYLTLVTRADDTKLSIHYSDGGNLTTISASSLETTSDTDLLLTCSVLKECANDKDELTWTEDGLELKDQMYGAGKDELVLEKTVKISAPACGRNLTCNRSHNQDTTSLRSVTVNCTVKAEEVYEAPESYSVGAIIGILCGLIVVLGILAVVLNKVM
ncbi:uncharacterized protein LOC108679662 [Hyalella azteca]|uniref:Uncharacterized protein LOC108679662 n=1 Tax=Hyalella azteca TaxID=294128 RepID=A0A8B7PCM5_HYAAZ|nr:uncharacterized protein LOC108679662 [Hyalella azteca]